MYLTVNCPYFAAGPASWLVRPSDSVQGDYSLYIHGGKHIQRFKIQKHGKQYHMGGRHYDR